MGSPALLLSSVHQVQMLRYATNRERAKQREASVGTGAGAGDGTILGPVRLQGQTSTRCMFIFPISPCLYHNMVASLVASPLSPSHWLLKKFF